MNEADVVGKRLGIVFDMPHPGEGIGGFSFNSINGTIIKQRDSFGLHIVCLDEIVPLEDSWVLSLMPSVPGDSYFFSGVSVKVDFEMMVQTGNHISEEQAYEWASISARSRSAAGQ